MSYVQLLRFYVPLSLTSIVLFAMRPFVSGSISRMPGALESLAALPVVTGLTSLLRSVGVSYNEVVVALLDRPRASHNLLHFSLLLTACVTLGLLIIVLTPLSRYWFVQVSGLSASLGNLANNGLLFALVLPALSVLQSWFQGNILHSGRTRSITEAVVICFGVTGAVLIGGIACRDITGLYVGFLALSSGELVRTIWLWWRSRAIRASLWIRDARSQ